jgi:hypothetical protein
MEISKKELIAGVAVILAGGLFLWTRTAKLDQESDDQPSKFIKTGIVVFRGEGVPQPTPYFTYEEPGKPALTKQLVFDAYSMCGSQTHEIACMAMSVTLDIPFGGKRVRLEGIPQEDGTVLIRRLMRLQD